MKPIRNLIHRLLKEAHLQLARVPDTPSHRYSRGYTLGMISALQTVLKFLELEEEKDGSV